MLDHTHKQAAGLLIILLVVTFYAPLWAQERLRRAFVRRQVCHLRAVAQSEVVCRRKRPR
jgi:hypothetical protein